MWLNDERAKLRLEMELSVPACLCSPFCASFYDFETKFSPKMNQLVVWIEKKLKIMQNTSPD